MILQQKKIERIGLSTIIYVFYNLYYISGYNGAYHNYVIVGLLLLWNLVAFWDNNRAYQRAVFCKPNMYLMFFMLFYFFTSTMVAGIVYTLEYIMIFLSFYGCLTQFLYYKYKNNRKELKLIIISTLLGFIHFAIKAISFYTINPSAARTLAADYTAFNIIAIGGGYAIAFGSAILTVGIFEMLLNGTIATSKFKKFLYYGIVICLFVLVVKTESTTTLIAMIVGCIITIIRRLAYGKDAYARDNGRKLSGTILIVFILLLILFNLNNIGKYIMDITGGNLEKLLNRRFYRIGEKLYYFGSDAGGDNYVDTRLGTIRESINTFLQYPLFGVGYKCGNVFSSLESFGVGTHSEAFDMLAQHGLVGASLFFAFLFSGLKKIYHTTQCKICIYPLMIMLIFNPFRYYHGYFAVFTLIPMISMYYGMLRPKEKRGQEDER
jgi:hypothetical protein